jgi:hypothetical protein
MVSRIHVQSPYYGSPYYGEGGTTNVQLPRVVAVVLEGYAAMLSRDLRIEKTRVQSQVCRSAVTVVWILGESSAGAVRIRACRKTSGDHSGIFINQPCLRHLAGVTCRKALIDITHIALWRSRQKLTPASSS